MRSARRCSGILLKSPHNKAPGSYYFLGAPCVLHLSHNTEDGTRIPHWRVTVSNPNKKTQEFASDIPGGKAAVGGTLCWIPVWDTLRMLEGVGRARMCAHKEKQRRAACHNDL